MHWNLDHRRIQQTGLHKTHIVFAHHSFHHPDPRIERVLVKFPATPSLHDSPDIITNARGQGRYVSSPKLKGGPSKNSFEADALMCPTEDALFPEPVRAQVSGTENKTKYWISRSSPTRQLKHICARHRHQLFLFYNRPLPNIICKVTCHLWRVTDGF